jgi:hypothetical protein
MEHQIEYDQNILLLPIDPNQDFLNVALMAQKYFLHQF